MSDTDLNPIRASATTAAILQQVVKAAGNQTYMNLGARMTYVGQEIAMVKCGTLRDEDNDIYDGTVNLLKADDLSWVEQPAPCWLMDAKKSELITGGYYGAIRYGMYALDGDDNVSDGLVRPVYVSWVEEIPPTTGGPSQEDAGCPSNLCPVGVAPICLFDCGDDGTLVPRDGFLQIWPPDLAARLGLSLAITFGCNGPPLTDTGGAT